MTKIFFDVLWFALGLALALPLGLLTMSHLRRSKRGGAVAFASALLFSFAYINPRNQEQIQEATDETKHKKGSQSGDPPDPGEETDP